jgi:tetratricopeptide (TPR) repeat protein
VGRFMEGLADAQRALSLATPGPPAQRAAQRLAFACLPQMQLDDALKAAKRSVIEAGDIPLLRARSLRILGLVQLWQHSPKAVDTLQRVPELCRRTGLMTRYPIALHDLGDAYRVSGELQKAREMYQETISLCEGLPLTSTVALCHFKLAMCDILDGQPSERLNRMDDLVAQGLRVGLGQSDRFGAFLCGWAHAKQEKVGPALESLQTAGDLVSLLVDPQMPQIIEEICTALVQRVLTSPDALPHLRGVSNLCRQARDVYGISGDMARLQTVERLLQRLPQVPR